MAFMTPTINSGKEAFIVHEKQEYGPDFLECTSLPNSLKAGVYAEDLTLAETVDMGLDLEDLTAIQDYLKENNIDAFEVTEPLYWGYLSAPGYMDQTDKVLGETYAEVALQLLDLYFDRDPEYMDEDEKGDRAWLEKIAAGINPKEAQA
jgi:hypothetical protein